MSDDTRYGPPAFAPTDEQIAIQTSTARAILVRANAGAAKTTTLALVAAQALHAGAAPEDLLVLAYTDPACDAMRAALARVGVAPPVIERLAVRTFDAFARDMLRSVERQGVPYRPSNEDLVPTVRDALARLDRDADSATIERFLAVARRLKGTLARDLAVWQGLPVDDDLALDLAVDPAFLALFTAYEHIRYARREGVDRPAFRGPFDATYDLACLLADPEPTTWLDEIPAWPRRLQWLLVDEMHDLNLASFEIVRALLKSPGLRFAGVGDIDQVVHADAGAERRFMSPDVDLGGRRVQVFPLTATHRFGRALAGFAGRLAGKPYASAAAHATTLQCIQYPGPAGQDCETLVVDTLRALKAAGTPASDCAVLLRHAWQSVALENALLRADIACATRGFTRYVLQPEVLLIRALIAVATGNYAPLAAVATRRELVRAVVFFCGIELGHEQSDTESPAERMRVALDAVARDAESLAPFIEFQVLARAAPPLAARMRRAIAIASEADATARRQGAPAAGWFDRFIDALDVRSWVRDVFVERQRRDDALHYFDGLKRAAASFATPAAFFDSLGADESRLKTTASGVKNAVRAAANRRKTVTLALASEVKGLEFDQVLMPYLAQGLFPSATATEAREERNLFYVGITRARIGLTLFTDRERPSEFVSAWQADTSPAGSGP